MVVVGLGVVESIQMACVRGSCSFCRRHEVFNVSMYVWPGVLSSEQVEGLVLARVSCGRVILLEL
jgi:hypothetical protein